MITYNINLCYFHNHKSWNVTLWPMHKYSNILCTCHSIFCRNSIIMFANSLATCLLPACCCRSSMWACCSGRSQSWTHPWSTLWRSTPEFTRQPIFTSVHMHNKMHICTRMWVGYWAPSSVERTATLMCFQTSNFHLVACRLRPEPSRLWRALGGDPKQENHQSRERSGSQQAGQ